jgi:hypothetical protein
MEHAPFFQSDKTGKGPAARLVLFVDYFISGPGR